MMTVNTNNAVPKAPQADNTKVKESLSPVANDGEEIAKKAAGMYRTKEFTATAVAILGGIFDIFGAIMAGISSINFGESANKMSVAIEKAGENPAILEFQYVQFGIFILSLLFFTMDAKILVWLSCFLACPFIVLFIPKLNNFICKPF